MTSAAPGTGTMGPGCVTTGPASSTPPLGDDHRDELHAAVGSLHSFVELFERVHAFRLWRLVLLAILNLADLFTTAWFLRLGGAERNPILAPIVHVWWTPLLVKIVIFAVVARAVGRSSVRARNVDWLLLMVVGYYAAVVSWNCWIIAQL